LRVLWKESLAAPLAQPEGLTSKFDPDELIWPKHERVVRSQPEGPTSALGSTVHRNDPISPSANEFIISNSYGDDLREDICHLQIDDEDEEDL
jgi:hypothetical protein